MAHACSDIDWHRAALGEPVLSSSQAAHVPVYIAGECVAWEGDLVEFWYFEGDIFQIFSVRYLVRNENISAVVVCGKITWCAKIDSDGSLDV